MCRFQSRRALPRAAAFVVSTVVILAPSAARAEQEADRLFDRLSVVLGADYATSNVDLNVKRKDGPGSERKFSVEDALGLGNPNFVGDLRLEFLLGRRHLFDVSYAKLDRSSTRTLSDTIEIGDVTFPVSARVRTEVNQQSLRLGYTYYFLRRERSALGVTGSLLLGSYDLKVRGSLDPGDLGFGLNFDESTTAPQPAIGVDYRTLLAERWRFRARAAGLSLNVADVDGTVYSLGGAIEYLVLPWMTLGAGANLNAFDATIDDRQLVWRVDSDVLAFTAFIRLRLP